MPKISHELDEQRFTRSQSYSTAQHSRMDVDEDTLMHEEGDEDGPSTSKAATTLRDPDALSDSEMPDGAVDQPDEFPPPLKMPSVKGKEPENALHAHDCMFFRVMIALFGAYGSLETYSGQSAYVLTAS